MFAGCIVGSFGIAITLALILLPLSICCSTVVYHPFYVFGLVTFILLTLFGGILCVCYPIMIKCWRYRESSKDSNAQHRKDSASKIYRYVSQKYIVMYLLKVSKSRKRFMVASILPKNERKKLTLLL